MTNKENKSNQILDTCLLVSQVILEDYPMK